MALGENRCIVLSKVEIDGSVCKHFYYQAFMFIAALLCHIKGAHMVSISFFSSKNHGFQNVSKRVQTCHCILNLVKKRVQTCRGGSGNTPLPDHRFEIYMVG